VQLTATALRSLTSTCSMCGRCGRASTISGWRTSVIMAAIQEVLEPWPWLTALAGVRGR